MKKSRTDRTLLALLGLSYLILAASFLLMPLGISEPDGNVPASTLIAGISFWCSVIGGTVVYGVLAYRRRKWYAVHRARKPQGKLQIGLITFFGNKYATVADIAFIISLLGVIVAVLVTGGRGYICFAFIASLVFFFGMHCILNGRTCYYVINRGKAPHTVEKTEKRS